MNCQEVDELIELFVLGELDTSQSAAVKAHLSGCSACRQAESECRLAIAMVKQSGRSERVGFGFNRKLRSALTAEIQKASRRLPLRRIVAAAASIAACVLFGLATFHFMVSSFEGEGVFAMKQITGTSSSVSQSQAGEFVICNGNMYLVDERNGSKITAVDIASGRERWRSELANCASIAADDSSVYCLVDAGSGKLDLVAINAADGKMRWRYPQECFDLSQDLSAPAILSGGRICWVLDTTIHMLQASNGKVLWSRSIAEDSLLSAAVAKGDSLYVAGTDGIYCLDATSGDESWRQIFSIEMDKKTKPLLAVSAGHIYTYLGIPNEQGILLSIKITDHKVNWARMISNVSSLYITEERLYVRNGGIHALDRMTSETLWSYACDGGGAITYANGRIYFVDSRQGLIALYEQTGNKVWQLAGMKSCDAFVKVGRFGYIKTRQGAIYKIILRG